MVAPIDLINDKMALRTILPLLLLRQLPHLLHQLILFTIVTRMRAVLTPRAHRRPTTPTPQLRVSAPRSDEGRALRRRAIHPLHGRRPELKARCSKSGTELGLEVLADVRWLDEPFTTPGREGAFVFEAGRDKHRHACGAE